MLILNQNERMRKDGEPVHRLGGGGGLTVVLSTYSHGVNKYSLMSPNRELETGAPSWLSGTGASQLQATSERRQFFDR